ncbi:MAG: hypothetical protein RL204_2408 [Bacteroidota bacterium]|jgi:hypothetical protein
MAKMVRGSITWIGQKYCVRLKRETIQVLKRFHMKQVRVELSKSGSDLHNCGLQNEKAPQLSLKGMFRICKIC